MTPVVSPPRCGHHYTLFLTINHATPFGPRLEGPKIPSSFIFHAHSTVDGIFSTK